MYFFISWVDERDVFDVAVVVIIWLDKLKGKAIFGCMWLSEERWYTWAYDNTFVDVFKLAMIINRLLIY